MIFLGDYGDRGEKGLEIIESLIKLKKLFGRRGMVLEPLHSTIRSRRKKEGSLEGVLQK